MAYVVNSITIKTVLLDGAGQATGRFSTTTASYGDLITTAATAITAQAAVATDVATLVADGASPTQAHVTTLNTHWGTLNTALAAMPVVAGDVVVMVNPATTLTVTALRHALNRAFELAMSGASGALTP